MKAMRVSNLDAYKIEATYVLLPKNFSFRLKHFVVDKIQIRVTWSHALALDCIRDILCIQFVQKTRGVDVCVFPPFLTRGRLLSRKRMRDAVPSCL